LVEPVPQSAYESVLEKTRKNNEQGNLDRTIKAAKNLLRIKKNKSFTNLNISLGPQEKMTGTSILFREHRRKSLYCCKSEGLIPTLKTSQNHYNDDHAPVKVHSRLHERRLQRQ